MKQDKIKIDQKEPPAWVCTCGNRAQGDGFSPCDKDGQRISPVQCPEWNGLYTCNKCGQIIDSDSLQIVGKR